MDELAEFKRTFFQECDELLGDLEGHLTALKDGEADAETLNAAFRAIHSIKGGAGALGFVELVTFAHVLENVLDLLRSRRLEPDDAKTALLIRAADVLADLVAAAQNDTPPPPGCGADVLRELHALAGSEPAAGGADEPEDFGFAPVQVAEDAPAPAPVPVPAEPDRRTVTIRFAPGAEMFRRANEPLLLIRELKRLGTLTTQADASGLPPLEEMEPDGAYLEWRFELLTTEPREAVEEVFEFVVGDCVLAIDEPAARAAGGAPAGGPAAAATPVAKTAAAAPPAPAPPLPVAGEPEPLVDPEVFAKVEPPADAERAPATAKSPALGNKAAAIRVDLDKIDRLVNMVGELVITQAMLSQQAAELAVDQHAGMLLGIETLALRSRELQESVMAIRAQPVKSVFSRMSRLVRELSANLGKEARLVVTGEETEVDKTVIEELAEPLTHMIRNSMDHGMEGPDERVAAGKPREGVIHLSAEHRSGRILISVADDGRGINRERVLRKAIEKGLLPAEARPSDEEIDNLIMMPGFSTAEQVSDVSGRGVGMDVVRRKIQNIGGRVGILSNPGRGVRITLTLPLTLAVLDGMVVKVGNESYILPITSIVETLKPDPEAVHRLAGGGEVLGMRGDYVRLVYLYRLFGVPGAVDDASHALVVVVETESRSHIGLVVDELLGQQQVVIKSLEANYQRVDGISGATILGTGMVALILDVDRVSEMADGGEPRRARLAPAGQDAGACH